MSDTSDVDYRDPQQVLFQHYNLGQTARGIVGIGPRSTAEPDTMFSHLQSDQFEGMDSGMSPRQETRQETTTPRTPMALPEG